MKKEFSGTIDTATGEVVFKSYKKELCDCFLRGSGIGAWIGIGIVATIKFVKAAK